MTCKFGHLNIYEELIAIVVKGMRKIDVETSQRKEDSMNNSCKINNSTQS